MNPLGLPAGSVRSIVTLMLVATFCSIAAGVIFIPELRTMEMTGVLAAVLTFTMSQVNNYMNQRGQQNGGGKEVQ